MSNSSDEQQSGDTSSNASGTGEGITDDKLPEDLRPTDDNPLAKPMGEDEDEDEDSEGGTSPSADLPDAGSPGAS